MKVIGIVGGIASGKSEVSNRLQTLGARHIDADKIGHEVLRLPEIIKEMRDHFGDSVLDKDGQIDRQAVAKRVFGVSPEAQSDLEYLERLTHPQIGRLISQQISQMKKDPGDGDAPAVVLDAPVMLKAGWDRFCDHVIFVDCGHSKRLKRALQRGWTVAEFHDREASQASLERKRSKAEFVVDNNGSLQNTFDQIQVFWDSLFNSEN